MNRDYLGPGEPVPCIQIVPVRRGLAAAGPPGPEPTPFVLVCRPVVPIRRNHVSRPLSDYPTWIK